MSKEHIWIEVGYKTFAYNGPSGLKVEKLAKAAKKNKSSFYHYFADLEIFISRLLTHHISQAEIMAEKEVKAQNEQELITIIIAHKLDLLFNRQLRFHRENPEYRDCFSRINEVSLPGLLPVWQKIMGLEENNYLANMVLMLSIENFFLQITDETLNESWLQAYFQNIKTMVFQFKKTHPTSILDGSV